MNDPKREPETLSSPWSGGEEGLTRTWKLEDDFAPHSLAATLAWVASREGVHPRFVLEGRTLTASLAPLPPEARTRYARAVDERLEVIRIGQGSENPRPAAALARLWVEAQDLWETAVRRLSPNDMDRPTHPGAKETIFTEAVRHPLRAGFGYLAWIRHVRNLPDTHPLHDPGSISSFTEREQVLAALPALTADVEATLSQVTEGAMEQRSYLSGWGDAYTVEQILEHGIVHLHRHRLQLERYLEAREAAAAGR